MAYTRWLSLAAAFADSAKDVLKRRVELRSWDAMWTEGWNKRIDTYKIFDVKGAESIFK